MREVLTIFIVKAYSQWYVLISMGIRMKEIITTVTQRSQVTIPAEVCRVLNIKPRDKIAFTIEKDRVSLAPAPFTLESAYGSVRSIGRQGSLEDISQAAKDAKAEQSVRESSER